MDRSERLRQAPLVSTSCTLRFALLCILSAACSGPAAPADAGADGSDRCASDEDCDDGRFCNGPERCAAGAPTADARGCTLADPPCSVSTCNEALDRCEECAGGGDVDGDGMLSIECGGSDCDDEDPARYPGNAEVCDPDGVDEDCDPSSIGGRDTDGDGSIDEACCNGALCGEDCDDTRANVHRLSPEVCDGIDNDCNGETDEGVLLSSWPDIDRDGWGDASATATLGCTVPSDRVDRGGDCNDDDSEIHPAASERCNVTDDDCDGEIDDGAATSCEATRPGSIAECREGACYVVGCTGARMDCNGSADDGCEVDPCTDRLHCDSCGRSCIAADAVCADGTCYPELMSGEVLGTLRDVDTGAPIAGATITLLGTCGTYSATTGADGQYTIRFDVGRWARIEAPGYPTHIQPRVGGVFGPLLSRARLDAWLASAGVSASSSRAILVSDQTGFRPILTTAQLAVPYYAVESELRAGEGPGPEGREVFLEALPGRAQVGGAVTASGCTRSCGAALELLLEAGAVTVVGGFECMEMCS